MSLAYPPLNPLRAFEAAASLERFSKAAKRLGITQSAVSRQVGIFEGSRGVKLFRRDRRGAVLTDLGREYFRNVSLALRQITCAALVNELRAIGLFAARIANVADVALSALTKTRDLVVTVPDESGGRLASASFSNQSGRRIAADRQADCD